MVYRRIIDGRGKDHHLCSMALQILDQPVERQRDAISDVVVRAREQRNTLTYQRTVAGEGCVSRAWMYEACHSRLTCSRTGLPKAKERTQRVGDRADGGCLLRSKKRFKWILLMTIRRFALRHTQRQGSYEGPFPRVFSAIASRKTRGFHPILIGAEQQDFARPCHQDLTQSRRLKEK
jgi:hypothetical protein